MFETGAGAFPPPPPPPPQPAMLSRVNNNPEYEDRLCFMDEVLDRAKTTVLSRVDSITFGIHARFGYPSVSRKNIGVAHEDAAQLSRRALGRRVGRAANARQSRHRGAACPGFK